MCLKLFRNLTVKYAFQGALTRRSRDQLNHVPDHNFLNYEIVEASHCVGVLRAVREHS